MNVRALSTWSSARVNQATRRAHRNTLWLLASLFAIVVPPRVSADEPEPAFFPVPFGGPGASSETSWVAPFVERTDVVQGVSHQYHVSWFSPTGAFLAGADSLVLSPTVAPYFTSAPSARPWTVYGIYGDWHLSADAAFAGSASADGRVFAQVLGPPGAAEALAIHVRGRLVSQIGSLPGMRLSVYGVGPDGSVAALFIARSAPDSCRAVVEDGDGTVRLTAAVPTGDSIFPASEGRGALLRHANGDLLYVAPNGEIHALPASCGLGLWCMVWVPGSSRAILAERSKGKYALVDCESGRVVWEIVPPAPGVSLADYVMPFGGYVLVSGIERRPSHDDPQAQVRVLWAFDLATGRQIARWTSTPSPCLGEMGKLTVRDGHLYFLAHDAFSEVRPEDIARAGGGNGGCCSWQSVTGSDRVSPRR